MRNHGSKSKSRVIPPRSIVQLVESLSNWLSWGWGISEHRDISPKLKPLRTLVQNLRDHRPSIALAYCALASAIFRRCTECCPTRWSTNGLTQNYSIHYQTVAARKSSVAAKSSTMQRAVGDQRISVAFVRSSWSQMPRGQEVMEHWQRYAVSGNWAFPKAHEITEM